MHLGSGQWNLEIPTAFVSMHMVASFDNAGHLAAKRTGSSYNVTYGQDIRKRSTAKFICACTAIPLNSLATFPYILHQKYLYV